MRTIVLRQRIQIALVAILLVLLASGCANTAGKNYTLAKINKSGNLQDPRSTVGENWDEHVNDVNGTLEIRLADHFLAYLASLGQPELVIFSRAVITDPSNRENEIVYEQIVLNTEDQATYSAGNQGGGGTMKDVVLLPAIKYNNQDVRIELRVIEMDSDDNQRAKSLITQAATTGGTFKVLAGPEITAIAGALNFLVANNKDDIEFSVDIGISGKNRAIVNADGTQSDVVLQPRVGTWLLIKTELPGRFYFAGDAVSIASDGILWAAANTLKLGTLNLLNAWNNDKEKSDNYMRLLGNPLGLSTSATTEPVLTNGNFAHVDGIHTACGLTGSLSGESAHPLVYDSGSLHVSYTCKDKDKSKITKVPFREKSYMALTLSSPVAAVDASALASLSEQISDLNIVTTQLKGEDYVTELKAAMASIETIAHVNNTMKTTSEQMANANNASEIEGIRDNNYKALEKKIEGLTGIDDTSRERVLKTAQLDMNQAAKRSVTNLAATQKLKTGIDMPTTSIEATDSAQVMMIESKDPLLAAGRIAKNGMLQTGASVAVASAGVVGRTDLYNVTLSNLGNSSGDYELILFTDSDSKKIPLRIAATCPADPNTEALKDELNRDGGILNTDSHAERAWQVCSMELSSCGQLDIDLGWLDSAHRPQRTLLESKNIIASRLAQENLAVSSFTHAEAKCE